MAVLSKLNCSRCRHLSRLLSRRSRLGIQPFAASCNWDFSSWRQVFVSKLVRLKSDLSSDPTRTVQNASILLDLSQLTEIAIAGHGTLHCLKGHLKSLKKQLWYSGRKKAGKCWQGSAQNCEAFCVQETSDSSSETNDLDVVAPNIQLRNRFLPLASSSLHEDIFCCIKKKKQSNRGKVEKRSQTSRDSQDHKKSSFHQEYIPMIERSNAWVQFASDVEYFCRARMFRSHSSDSIRFFKNRSSRTNFQTYTEVTRHVRGCNACSCLYRVFHPAQVIKVLLLIGCVESNPGPGSPMAQNDFHQNAILSFSKHMYAVPGHPSEVHKSVPFFQQLFGLLLRRVHPDGDCLFGCFYRSCLNYGINTGALGDYDTCMLHLRTIVVNFLRAYQPGTDRDLDVYLAASPSLSVYCDNISLRNIRSKNEMTAANFGDSLCIEVLSRLFSVEVQVASFNRNGCRVDCFPSYGFRQSRGSIPNLARFFFALQAEHYDFCLPFNSDLTCVVMPTADPELNPIPFSHSFQDFPPLSFPKRIPHVWPAAPALIKKKVKSSKSSRLQVPIGKDIKPSKIRPVSSVPAANLSCFSTPKKNTFTSNEERLSADKIFESRVNTVHSVPSPRIEEADSSFSPQVLNPVLTSSEQKLLQVRDLSKLSSIEKQKRTNAQRRSRRASKGLRFSDQPSKPVITASEEKLLKVTRLSVLSSADRKRRQNAQRRYKRAANKMLGFPDAPPSLSDSIPQTVEVQQNIAEVSMNDEDLVEPIYGMSQDTDADCDPKANYDDIRLTKRKRVVSPSYCFASSSPGSRSRRQRKKVCRASRMEEKELLRSAQPEGDFSICFHCKKKECEFLGSWPFNVDDDSVTERQVKCLLDFLKETRIDAMRKTCCVCAEDKPVAVVKGFEANECSKFLSLLKKVNPSDDSQTISSSFDVNNFYFSPHGVHIDETTGSCRLDICSTCELALMPKKKQPSLPKFAIANGNDFGNIPAVFKDLTYVEEMLISPYRPIVYVLKLKDGGGSFAYRAIKGNVIAFPKTHNLINLKLPHALNSLPDYFQVCFIGDRSKIQRKDIKRFLGVRKKVVIEALEHLRKIYPNVSLSQDDLDQLPDDDIPDVLYHNIRSVTENEIVNVHAFDEAEHDGYAKHDEMGQSSDNVNNSSETTGNQPLVFHVEKTVYEDDCGATVGIEELAAQTLSALKKDYITASKSSVTGEQNEESAESRRNIMKAFEEPPSNNKVLRVSNKRTAVNEFNNPDLWRFGWVSLFPNGTGMPEGIERASKYSLEAWAKHVLCLHDSPFARHPTFPLYLSNVLKRRKVLQLASLKLKSSSFKREAAQLSKLNLADLIAQVKKMEFQDQISDKEYLRATRMISLFGGKVPFSRFARSENRREMFGLCSRYGPANLYITINPNDYCSRQVLYFSKKTHHININLSEFPKYQQCKQYALENPAACAEFFNLFITAFNKCMVVGNDPEVGGIFGPVNAYYGTVETQGRGTLHYHSLVWLKDIPSPQKMAELLKSDCFRARFAKYLDSIICCTAPNVPEALEKVAPSHEYTPLHAAGFSVDSGDFSHFFYYLLSKCQKHKCTFTCRKGAASKSKGANFCRFGYHKKKNEVLFTVVHPDGSTKHKRRKDSKLNPTNWPTLFAIQSNNDIQFIPCFGDKRSVVIYCTKYITKEDIKTHNSLAMLGLAAGKVLVEGSTFVNEDQAKRIFQKIQFQMNTHTETPAPLAMQFLLGHPDHYKNHRFVKLYTTPFLDSLNSVDVPRALPCDVQNDGEDDDAEEMLHIRFDPVTGKVLLVNQLTDYLCRNPHLWAYSYYELFAFFHKYKFQSKYKYSNPFDEHGNLKSRAEVKCDPSRSRMHDFFEFCEAHPEHATHAFKRHSGNQEWVPVTYKILPRKKSNPDIHAKMALILFFPFHSLNELRSQGESSWSEIWENKLRSGLINDYCLKVYNNILAFHDAEDQCDEDRKCNDQEHTENSDDVEDGGAAPADEIHGSFDADAALNKDQEDFEKTVVNDNEVFNPAKVNKMDKSFEDRPELQGVCSLVQKIRSSHDSSENDFIGTNDAGMDSLFRVSSYSESMGQRWLNELKRQSKLAENSDLDHECGKDPLDRNMFDGLISPLISQSEEPLVVTGADPFKDQIKEVAGKFNLNQRQSFALKLVGEHLAKTILADSDQQSQQELDQLLLFITGEGGTGKSRVISAIQDIFVKFGKKNWLVTSGTTGKAGCLIDGGTIHGYVKCSYDKTNVRFEDKQVKGLQDFWLRKRYLIIDEISMLDAAFFSYVSAALSVGKGGKAKEAAFGGVNVICCGDLYQFPPVFGRPLYWPPISGDHPVQASTTENASNTGLLIFEKFETVVLTEQVRQVGDPNFHNLLRRLRHGSCTAEDHKLLTSRLLHQNVEEATTKLNFFSLTGETNSKIIVAENSFRTEINEYMVLEFAKYHNVPCFKFYSSDKPPKVTISENVRSYIKTLPETKTGQIPGILFCAPGIPMILTQNVDKGLRLYNSQNARFLDFIPHQDDKQVYSLKGFQIYEVKLLPKFLILHVPQTPFCLEEQPKGFVPLAPQSTTFSIPFLNKTGRQKAAFTVNRDGFPVVPGFAVTRHRSQGDTLGSGVIDLVPHNRCSSFQKTPAAYVPVSRFRSSSDLYVLRDFNISAIQAGVHPHLKSFMNQKCKDGDRLLGDRCP